MPMKFCPMMVGGECTIRPAQQTASSMAFRIRMFLEEVSTEEILISPSFRTLHKCSWVEIGRSK